MNLVGDNVLWLTIAPRKVGVTTGNRMNSFILYTTCCRLKVGFHPIASWVSAKAEFTVTNWIFGPPNVSKDYPQGARSVHSYIGTSDCRYFSICKDIVAYNAGLRLSHRSRIYREPRSSDSITPSFTIRHWSALMHELELKLIRRRCQWLYYPMILHSFWAGGAAHRIEISTIVNSFKCSPIGNNNPRLHNDLVHILPKKIQKGYDISESISRRTVAETSGYWRSYILL